MFIPRMFNIVHLAIHYYLSSIMISILLVEKWRSETLILAILGDSFRSYANMKIGSNYYFGSQIRQAKAVQNWWLPIFSMFNICTYYCSTYLTYNLETIFEQNGVSAHKIGCHVSDDYGQISGCNITIFYNDVKIFM